MVIALHRNGVGQGKDYGTGDVDRGGAWQDGGAGQEEQGCPA